MIKAYLEYRKVEHKLYYAHYMPATNSEHQLVRESQVDNSHTDLSPVKQSLSKHCRSKSAYCSAQNALEKIIEGTNAYSNNAFNFKLSLHLENQHATAIGTKVPPWQ